MATSEQHLIWLDLEMTGLDPFTDRILEVATVVTDQDLNHRGRGPGDRRPPIGGGPGRAGRLES